MKLKLLFISVTTLAVIFYKKTIVIGMIVFGSLFFPEASSALSHYCFGDGSQLNVSPDYIKNSPVVKKHLSQMRVGEKRRVTMRQSEDWRLSFAINPFTIEKKRDRVVITQWMNFDKSGKVYTWFGPFKISDNIVHVFDCTPYMFRCEWKTN